MKREKWNMKHSFKENASCYVFHALFALKERNGFHVRRVRE